MTPDPWAPVRPLAGLPVLAVTDSLRRLALEHPERPALEDDRVCLTLGEVVDAMDGLAAGVAARGRAPVAIHAVQEPRTVLAMLGVFASGRLCVLIDPREPPERQRDVLERTGADLVLAGPGVRDEVAAAVSGAEIGIVEELLGAPRAMHPAEVDVEGPALVCFTSGSTGRPKGVIRSHAAFARQAREHAALLGYGPADVVASSTPLAFGGVFSSVAAGLLSGAVVHCYDVTRRGVRSMPGWICERGVSALKLIPSVLRSLLDELEQQRTHAGSVRIVTLGAEAASVADARRARAAFPQARLLNLYGSAESGIIAVFEVPPEPNGPEGPLPVGQIGPGLRVELVDELGAPVALGEVGEVVVRGPTVALGYWGAPELTAERFSTGVDGVRSVRVGDLGRLGPSGRLELVGRTDDRVKVRGQGVDLLAVECAIATLSGVADVGVSAVTQPDGSSRLVAHVVAEPGAVITVGGLRRGLSERLPAYMVPSMFRGVTAIPRTSRGKVDRMALRGAAAEALSRGVERVAPRDERERRLAELFAEVLELSPDEVGVSDDFFDLGGDSLAAVELAAAVGATFGVDGLGPFESTMHRSATVADLVRSLDGDGARLAAPLRDGGSVILLDAPAAGPDRRPFFYVAGGAAGTLRHAALARRLDRATYSFRLPGLHAGAPAAPTIEDLAARYVEGVRAVQAAGPYLLGGYSFGALVAFEMARRLEREGTPVDLLVLVDRPLWSTLPSPAARVGATLRGSGGPGAKGAVLARKTVSFVRRRARRAGRRLQRRLDRRRPGTADRRTVMKRYIRRLARRQRLGPYGGPTLIVRTEGRLKQGLEADLGWARHLTGEWRTVEVPGNHMTLVAEPYVRVLAETLVDAFHRVEARG